MNDYAGLAAALVIGSGIGEFPPIVVPHLLRDGLLVELSSEWKFSEREVCLVHLSKRHVPKQELLFKEFANQMALELFPVLPN